MRLAPTRRNPFEPTMLWMKNARRAPDVKQRRNNPRRREFFTSIFASAVPKSVETSVTCVVHTIGVAAVEAFCAPIAFAFKKPNTNWSIDSGEYWLV